MGNFIGIRKIGQNKKSIEKLLKVKSLSTLKGDLQKVFNEFIRKRDTQQGQLHGTKYFVCISCGQSKGLEQMHCGHFFPVGGHEAVRFDEDNAHGQCVACNTFHHGNLLKYKDNLIKKIGKVMFERLELRSHNLSKMTRFEVEFLIMEYKTKIKDLK